MKIVEVVLPTVDNCAIHSLAHVIGVPVEQVWEHAKQFWKRGFGMSPAQQSHVLQRFGLTTRWRHDLIFRPRRGPNDYSLVAHTLGQLLRLLEKQPPNARFLISTRGHSIAFAFGKLMDVADTSDRARIQLVYEVVPAVMRESVEPQLIEMVENGRLVARLADGSLPPYVYRVMSIREYEQGMQLGRFVPRPRERIHAAIRPLLQYCEPGPVNALVRFDFRDEDGWQPKWMSDELVVITHQPIPAARAHLVASGTRQNLQAARNMTEAAIPVPEMAFEQIQTGQPAMFYGYRGTGGNPLRSKLTPRWQARLGRDTLLGDGIYVTPSKSIAGNYGDAQMVKVTTYRPYVLPHADSHALQRMPYDEIRRNHDCIAVMSGTMYNEDMRQAVIFPEFANQVEFLTERPTMTALQRGAKVRVIKVPQYRQAELGHLVGQIGTVTQILFGQHPHVRIRGKVYLLNGDDVEVIG